MNKLVKRAFDSNAWTYVGNSYGQAVAPAMYDEQVMMYQKKGLVVAPLAKQIDFRKPGHTWTVTVDAAPSAASVLVETDTVGVQAITNRQVTFTPVEYGVKFEGSYTELEDGFLPFMENATEKIGYAMADKKDAIALAALYAGATTTDLVNGKSVTTDLASTDTFNTTAIVDARVTIQTYLYKPKDLIISNFQEGSLLKITNIYKANEFGTRSAIANGLIGNLFGFDIYVSDNITATSNVEYALALGKTRTNESSFAIAIARDPKVEMDKDISFRKVLVVGTERYNVQVIHPNAIVKIGTYQ